MRCNEVSDLIILKYNFPKVKFSGFINILE